MVIHLSDILGIHKAFYSDAVLSVSHDAEELGDDRLRLSGGIRGVGRCEHEVGQRRIIIYFSALLHLK